MLSNKHAILLALCIACTFGTIKAFVPRTFSIKQYFVQKLSPINFVSSQENKEKVHKRVPLFFAKDLMDELNELESGEMPQNDSTKAKKKDKSAVKLEPEITIFEGPPSPTELLLPAVSILTIIGIIPFLAAVSRQVWVKYRITSRRISIQSGIGGKDLVEVIYSEIRDMKYIYRAFGAAGDVAITLADGSKLEIRSLPRFEELYQYMFDKISPEAQETSAKIKKPE